MQTSVVDFSARKNGKGKKYVYCVVFFPKELSSYTLLFSTPQCVLCNRYSLKGSKDVGQVLQLLVENVLS